MKTKNIILFFSGLLSIILMSCHGYYVLQESLVSTLSEKQQIIQDTSLYKKNSIIHPEVKFDSIPGRYSKSGMDIWFYPVNDVNFYVKHLVDSRPKKSFLETIYLQNDTLFGVKLKNSGFELIPLESISEIQFFTFPVRKRVVKK